MKDVRTIWEEDKYSTCELLHHRRRDNVKENSKPNNETATGKIRNVESPANKNSGQK